MARVAFVNPPGWAGRDDSGSWRAWVRSGSRWPFTMSVQSSPDNFVWGGYLPYAHFLGYAASYARAAGHDVLFRDSIALRESYDSFFDFIFTNIRSGDFVVFESATPSWEHDRELIASLAASGAQVILTGPIATARGADLLISEPIIAAVSGEYEKGVCRVLAGERGLIHHDLLTTAEMNAAPPPWLDDLHAHRYCDSNPRGQRFPHLQVWSSRGCQFACQFCVWPAVMTGNDPDGTGKRIPRLYTEDYMVAYLTETVARYGFRSIYDDSDTFNIGTRHTEAMCRAYRRIGLPWSAMCRIDTIGPATWELMRESGCFGVKVGFESGSDHVVNKIIGKRLDLRRARETVFLLKRLGFTVHGTFSIGHPGETREQMRETVEYIASLPLDSYQCSGVAAIEGTPLATLLQVGTLKRYPGAKVTADFDRETDGNVKVQRLAKELSNG